MNGKKRIEVALRLWSRDDLPLLKRLRGDPAMNVHLGGPEAPEKIRELQERYYQSSITGINLMFVILAGPEKAPARSIGYWEKEWQGQQIWETGWSMLPEFQGKGIATRATRFIIERVRAAGKHLVCRLVQLNFQPQDLFVSSCLGRLFCFPSTQTRSILYL